MSESRCSMTMKAPGLTRCIEADTLEGFVCEVLSSLVRTPICSTSAVARAGLELDLLLCYLHGLTIDEAIDVLEQHRGFKTSSTAIGRYWKLLHDKNILQLQDREVPKHKKNL